jgi:hypothetical protein
MRLKDFDLRLDGQVKLTCGCGWYFDFGQGTAMINLGVLDQVAHAHTEHLPIEHCDHSYHSVALGGKRNCIVCMKEL